MPSGYGGSSGASRTAWRSGTPKADSSRPGSASAASGMALDLRRNMLRSPFMGSLIQSRLGLERYSQADLDVAAQGVRGRAAALTVAGQALELGLVDAGDAAAHRQVDAGYREPAVDGAERAGGVDVDPLRRVTRLRQRIREGHRVAGRVRGRDQLLGARVGIRSFGPRLPGQGLLRERAARDAHRPLAARQVALPHGACSRFGHVDLLPYAFPHDTRGRPRGSVAACRRCTCGCRGRWRSAWARGA